jgi:hypothetical protein
MHHNCQECTRLWAEYALATRHYLNLEGRLQIAHVSRDEKTLAQLTPMLQRADQERADLRRSISEHEARGRTESDWNGLADAASA